MKEHYYNIMTGEVKSRSEWEDIWEHDKFNQLINDDYFVLATLEGGNWEEVIQ